MSENGKEQLEPQKVTYSKAEFARVDESIKAARAKISPNSPVEELEATIKLERTRNALLNQAYEDASRENKQFDEKVWQQRQQNGQSTNKPSSSWLFSNARKFGKGLVKGFTDPLSIFGKSTDASGAQHPKTKTEKAVAAFKAVTDPLNLFHK